MLIEVIGMRILQLVKWLSPKEDSGVKIRSYRLGRLLAAFADVDVIGFLPWHERLDGTEQHLGFYRKLFPIPWKGSACSFIRCIPGALKGRSLRSSRFYNREYCRMLAHLIAQDHYDAIQVEELPMMSMLEPLTLKQPIVYSAHNVESELSFDIFIKSNICLRLLAKMEERLTRMEEAKALERAGVCFAVSHKDKIKFEKLSIRKTPTVYVLPNCADDRFCPSLSRAPKKEIIAVGCFGWRPNAQGILWFVEYVLPYLKRRLPDYKVRVIGSDIGSRLARKLYQSGCYTNPNVPDILPFLQEARVLIVPLHTGGGTRIKILEAWAAGLPVVSTHTGADGLECDAGSDILVADNPEEFAGLVHAVATDDDLYVTLRTGGLKRAEECRWSHLSAKLKPIYESEKVRLGYQ